MTPLKNFKKRLSQWGFRQITQGQNTGAYYHIWFVRDKPELMSQHKMAQCKEQMTKIPLYVPLDDCDKEDQLSDPGSKAAEESITSSIAYSAGTSAEPSSSAKSCAATNPACNDKIVLFKHQTAECSPFVPLDSNPRKDVELQAKNPSPEKPAGQAKAISSPPSADSAPDATNFQSQNNETMEKNQSKVSEVEMKTQSNSGATASTSSPVNGPKLPSAASTAAIHISVLTNQLVDSHDTCQRAGNASTNIQVTNNERVSFDAVEKIVDKSSIENGREEDNDAIIGGDLMGSVNSGERKTTKLAQSDGSVISSLSSCLDDINDTKNPVSNESERRAPPSRLVDMTHRVPRGPSNSQHSNMSPFVALNASRNSLHQNTNSNRGSRESEMLWDAQSVLASRHNPSLNMYSQQGSPRDHGSHQSRSFRPVSQTHHSTSFERPILTFEDAREYFSQTHHSTSSELPPPCTVHCTHHTHHAQQEQPHPLHYSRSPQRPIPHQETATHNASLSVPFTVDDAQVRVFAEWLIRSRLWNQNRFTDFCTRFIFSCAMSQANATLQPLLNDLNSTSTQILLGVPHNMNQTISIEAEQIIRNLLNQSNVSFHTLFTHAIDWEINLMHSQNGC